MLQNVRARKPQTLVHLYAHASVEEIAKAGSTVIANSVRVAQPHLPYLLKKANAVIPYLALFKDKARKIPLDL